mmetsp:Transcript_7777/g.26772  ORF Transcript_7777/g.26772 Transcript_7777/m.26772 type:complete len:231 (-) Transcript_7777:1655-2347(-)
MSMKLAWATANLPSACMTSRLTMGDPSFAHWSRSPAACLSATILSGDLMCSETSSWEMSCCLSDLMRTMREPRAKMAAALTLGEAELKSLESFSVTPSSNACIVSSKESSQIFPRQRQSHCASRAVDPEITLVGPSCRDPRQTSTSLAWAHALWPLGWLWHTTDRMKAAPALDSGGMAESGISKNRMKYMKLESLVRSILQLWSRARILVQMKTRICLSSFAVVCSSLRT